MSDGTVRTYPIVVVDRRKAKPLLAYRCRELIGIRDVRMYRHHGQMFRGIPLSSQLRRAIARTLNRYNGKFEHSFDCHAFVHLACGVPLERDRPILNRWEPIAWSDGPNPGEAVFFVDLEHFIFHHSAIFLGRGLYLSVYGKGGILQISALSDMVHDYDTRHILRMRPRNTE